MMGPAKCTMCGGAWSAEKTVIVHAVNCPFADKTPENVTSFGAARFKRTDKPEETRVEDVLHAALEHYRTADEKPDHVIVLFGRNPADGGSATKYMQGGTFRYHSQIGLCYEGANMLRDEG